MVAGHRSDVLLQGLVAHQFTRAELPVEVLITEVPIGGDVAWDAGEQALMRGLDTACPCIRPGLVLSYNGRRDCRPQSVSGNSPFNATSPPIDTITISGRTAGQAAAGGASILAMAHMKAASSRAIAVTATVLRLPRATRAR